jgi:hypothetical protein
MTKEEIDRINLDLGRIKIELNTIFEKIEHIEQIIGKVPINNQ